MKALDEAQRLLRDEVESRGMGRGLDREDGRGGRGKDPGRGTGTKITDSGLAQGHSEGGGDPTLASVCLHDSFITFSTPGSPARTRSCPGWRW